MSQEIWINLPVKNAGFADLDGHRWNLLYMDESKMPKR